MFIRFPDITEREPRKRILVNDIPYSFYSMTKASGKKSVFLTENVAFFVLNGIKFIHLSDTTIQIDKHAVCLIKRGIYLMSEYIPEGENFEIIHFFIPDSYFSKYYNNEQKTVRGDGPFCVIQNNELIISFIQQFKIYFAKENIADLKTLMQLKFQELLLLMNGSNEKQKVQSFIQSLPYNSPLDIEYIVREYLFQPITIDELARLSGRSTATFKREFEHRFQASPRKWINTERLKQARRLLDQSDKTVAEIAYECGYENISHFIRIYRAQYGETPASVRKEKTSLSMSRTKRAII